MNSSKLTFKRIITGVKIRWWKITNNYKNLADYFYSKTFGKKINWENPEDLNQWINWLAFNTDTHSWSLLADKYRVREYIEKKGFKDNLVPLLAVWDSPEKIDFSYLPDRFVIKANNGAGDVMIIKNKNMANIDEVKKYFHKLFQFPFGKDTAEPHYLSIKPLIIVEKFLNPKDQKFNSTSLIDYKFWCFNGKPDRCFVCSNRSKSHYNIDLYKADMSWERIADGNLIYNKTHSESPNPVPCPDGLTKMLEIASVLSFGFPQMRVDFYEVGGKVYVGELTMTGACGRTTSHTDKSLKYMGLLCKKAVENLNIKQI